MTQDTGKVNRHLKYNHGGIANWITAPHVLHMELNSIGGTCPACAPGRSTGRSAAAAPSLCVYCRFGLRVSVYWFRLLETETGQQSIY